MQAQSLANFQNIIFDCDSTLTALEGIDWLAQKAGKEREITFLTEQAMNGKIKFEEALAKRLALIKPPKRNVELLGQEYIKNQTADAPEVIRLLQSFHKNIFVISGGYSLAVKRFTDYLMIPPEKIFAIDLLFDKNGQYAGYDSENPLAKTDGKVKIVGQIASRGPTILVGDGFTDLQAKDQVDLFVGFGGVKTRAIVQQKADIFIKTKSLMPVVWLACGHCLLANHSAANCLCLT